MNQRRPHDFHPDLAPERLAVVIQIIKEQRTRGYGLVNAAEPEAKWSSGSTAYEFTRLAFKRISAAGTYPWLRYQLEAGQAYVLHIGCIPIRVQRSDDNPKVPMNTEAKALQTLAGQIELFAGDTAIDHYMFRLEVDVVGAGIDGCHLRVWGTDGKKEIPYHDWALEDAAPGVVVGLPKREAQNLPPADFEVRDENEQSADDEAIG